MGLAGMWFRSVWVSVSLFRIVPNLLGAGGEEGEKREHQLSWQRQAEAEVVDLLVSFCFRKMEH
jgi:hypothetical protein